MRGALDLDGVTVAFRLADGGTYTAVEGASLSVADGETRQCTLRDRAAEPRLGMRGLARKGFCRD